MGVDGVNFQLQIIEISRDVGGRKGTVYELHGHRNKVTCMSYLATSKRLMSCGEDGNLILWNMAVEREEVNEARSFRCALLSPLTIFKSYFKLHFRFQTADWNQCDNCQLCNRPFFWNFKAMYDQKQIGLRQHHCR